MKTKKSQLMHLFVQANSSYGVQTEKDKDGNIKFKEMSKGQKKLFRKYMSLRRSK